MTRRVTGPAARERGESIAGGRQPALRGPESLAATPAGGRPRQRERAGARAANGGPLLPGARAARRLRRGATCRCRASRWPPTCSTRWRAAVPGCCCRWCADPSRSTGCDLPEPDPRRARSASRSRPARASVRTRSGPSTAVLVPALAVDRAGHRLGRGGGHYDRTLALLGDGPRPDRGALRRRAGRRRAGGPVRRAGDRRRRAVGRPGGTAPTVTAQCGRPGNAGRHLRGRRLGRIIESGSLRCRVPAADSAPSTSIDRDDHPRGGSGGLVPTYQYACAECGHRFEAVQSFTDDSLTACPECGGQLRKVYGSVGVVFKGSGFYRTDSRGRRQVGGRHGPTAASPAAGRRPRQPSRATPASPTAPAPAGSSKSAAKPAAGTSGSGSGGGSGTSAVRRPAARPPRARRPSPAEARILDQVTARRPSPHASRRSGSSRRVIAPLAALALALSACTSTSGATDSVSPSSRGVTGSPGSPAGTASTPSPAPSSTGPATPATTTQAEHGCVRRGPDRRGRARSPARWRAPSSPT